MNERYAKRTEYGISMRIPKTVNYNNVHYINPPEDVLLAIGYKKFIEVEPPMLDDKHIATLDYEETDTEMRTKWTIIESGDRFNNGSSEQMVYSEGE